MVSVYSINYMYIDIIKLNLVRSDEKLNYEKFIITRMFSAC